MAGDKIAVPKIILSAFIGSALSVIGGVWYLSATLATDSTKIYAIEQTIGDHEIRLRALERAPQRTDSTHYFYRSSYSAEQRIP